MKTTSPKSLTIDESLALLEQLVKHKRTDFSKRCAIRNRLIALLMLDAGLRIGEVLQLQIGDLVIEEQPVSAILVRKAIAKCRYERTIKVTSELHQAILGAWLFIWCVDKRAHTSLCFYSHKSKNAMTPQQVQWILAKTGKKACHRHVHPHMLRHTFATRLMLVTSMRVVQQMLGHRRLSSTQIYTHPSQTDQDRAIDKMASKS